MRCLLQQSFCALFTGLEMRFGKLQVWSHYWSLSVWFSICFCFVQLFGKFLLSQHIPILATSPFEQHSCLNWTYQLSTNFLLKLTCLLKRASNVSFSWHYYNILVEVFSFELRFLVDGCIDHRCKSTRHRTYDTECPTFRLRSYVTVLFGWWFN